MKKTLVINFLLTVMILSAQRNNRAAKMAPLYSEGYYVNQRGDTVHGQIQNNPDKVTHFHKQFIFKSGKQKPRNFTPQKAKAYGLDGKDYVLAIIDGEKVFLERLVSGRIRFYEHRFEGKVDGYPAIESAFYVKDTDPAGDEKNLAEFKKISEKFYKKALKPYLKDQPMIWADLDKYNFHKKSVLEALKEFNKFYETN